jgi:membrane protease subunit HflK
VNWENKDKDPWGGKNDAPDFDELIKKFSSILGGKKTIFKWLKWWVRRR